MHPQAKFSFYSRASLDELKSGTLKACRDGGLECYEGKLPASSSGNTVDFGIRDAWTGPIAFSEDAWTTIHFNWSGLEAQPPFSNGERFTLELVKPNNALTLLDRQVNFEIVQDCAGSCNVAYLDLRSEPNGDGEGGAGPQ